MQKCSEFKPRFRGAYSDMHCCNHPAVPLDKLDASEQVVAYKSTGIDNVAAVWAKDHWGYSYYPTKVGVPHPKLRGDYTGEMVRLLHKEGIQAYGYFSLGFDNIGVITHPEWGAIDKLGRPIRVMLGPDKLRWYWVCFATPYRNYVIAHIKEIARRYDFDGLFIDINEAHHAEGFCYCDSCRKQIHSIYGVDIMKEDLPWEQIVDWWWNKLELQMMKEIRNAIKSIKPDMSVSANADSFLFGKEFMNLLDYTFRDFLYFETGFEQAMQLRSSGVKYYQVGFHSVPETYDPMPIDITRTVISGILAQGGLPAMYFEAEKADGSFETQNFPRLAKVFKEITQKREYLVEADAIRCLGLYFSWYSMHRPGHCHHLSNGLTGALRGATNCFVPAHVPLDIITSYNVTSQLLSEYDLIVLPECTNLSEREARQIREFVHKGGKLIATGQTGLFDDKWKQRTNFALADVFGLDFTDVDETYAINRTGAWIRCSSHEMFGEFQGNSLKTGPRTIKVKPIAGETIATFELPCLVETYDEFVCWGPPPPGRKTKRPALHLHKFGQGHCLYIAYDIFLHADKGCWWPKSLSVNILQWLLPGVPISVKGHKGLKCSFMRQPAQNRIVVHMINSTSIDLKSMCIPLGPTSICINSQYFPIKEAKEVFPRKRFLPLEKHGETMIVHTDVTDVHHIIVLDLY